MEGKEDTVLKYSFTRTGVEPKKAADFLIATLDNSHFLGYYISRTMPAAWDMPNSDKHTKLSRHGYSCMEKTFKQFKDKAQSEGFKDRKLNTDIHVCTYPSQRLLINMGIEEELEKVLSMNLYIRVEDYSSEGNMFNICVITDETIIGPRTIIRPIDSENAEKVIVPTQLVIDAYETWFKSIDQAVQEVALKCLGNEVFFSSR